MVTKNKQINVTLSFENYEKIKKKAEKSLRSLSNYMVFCSLEHENVDETDVFLEKNQD